MFPSFKIGQEYIYTYPMLMGMAWGLAFHLFYYFRQKHKIIFHYPTIYFVGVFMASWLGAKVFFLLTTTNTASGQLLNSTNFWLGGGFVFYGGLIGGILFTILFKYLTKTDWISFNIILPSLGHAHAVGRVGCLLAGCCFGIIWDGPFSVHLHGHDRFPVQLIEAIGLVMIAWIVQRSILKKYAVVLYLGCYSVLRFILEFFRGDQIRGVYRLNLSTSQYVSIGIWAILIVYLLINLKKFRFRN
jgi:phosphatidylglycerol---prolipoprotein diacylglyceryl transferase